MSVLSADNEPPADVSASRSALAVLFSVVFLDNLGFAIVLPYLYFYATSLGASPLTYGVLLASYSLMSFVSTPIVARLSDRYGRRRILLVALAVSSFSYFVFGTANSVWLLFLGRMLAGTTAATVPVAQAYVADVTSSKDRLRYLGLLGAAAGLAFILGPAIGGPLGDLLGYSVPSFLASALALSNLISAYLRLPEPSRFGGIEKKESVSFKSLNEVLKKKQIRLLFVVYFLFFMAFVFLQATLSPWLQAVFGFSALQTGLLFFCIGGVSTFTQAILLPKLAKKRSRTTLTVAGVLALATGLAILSLATDLVSLTAIIIVISFGFGILYLTLNTLISTNAPSAAQGGTLGVAWALAALAQTLAPALATSAFSYGLSVGFSGLAFLISAAISFATLPLVLTFRQSTIE